MRQNYETERSDNPEIKSHEMKYPLEIDNDIKLIQKICKNCNKNKNDINSCHIQYIKKVCYRNHYSREFKNFLCTRWNFNEGYKTKFVSVYEVCLKSNETVHIPILFQTKNQNYNLSPSKHSPWALMHFAILLCHASIHSWKDFSGMPRSSFVTASFMCSTSLNIVPLMVPLSFGNKKVTWSKEVDP